MTVYRFLDYVLNPAEGTLRRGGSTCQLAPKVVATLSVLVENSGQVVSKDRLMETVWKGTFVEENNLTQYIFLLRRFFQEDHPDQEFIKTVPRRGYSFNVPVEAIEGDVVTRPGALLTPHESPSLFWKRPIWLALLVLIAALFGASFIYRSFVKPAVLNIAELKIRRLTQGGNLVGAALSPDGNSVVYTVRDGAEQYLRLKNIRTDSEVQILGPLKLEINSPRFSPDGNSVFYGLVDASGTSQIFRIPVYGGGPLKIADGQMSDFSVSPDANWIAFPRRVPSKDLHQLVLAATDGSGEHVLAERTGKKYYSLWGPAPAWSPDGSNLVVAAGAFDSPDEELVSIDAQTGVESPVTTTQNWEYIGSVAWNDPDTLVVTASDRRRSNEQIWKVEMPAGKASRVSNDLASYSGISIDPRTKKILAMQETNNFHLWLWDGTNNAARELTTGEGHSDGTQGVAIAPDETILFTARDKSSLNIFETDKNGRTPTALLTENAGNNFEPTVARDGSLVAFVSDRSGQDRIWIANPDGSGQRMLVANAGSADPPERTPKFSPDGTTVYFLSMNGTLAQVMKVPLDGSRQPEPVDVPANEILPAVSPDGSLLSVGRAVGDNASKINVITLNGSLPVARVFDFPAYRMLSEWMPDSHSLVTINGSSDGNELVAHDLAAGTERPLTAFTNERIERFAISPNGQWFVVSRGTASVDAVLFEK